MDSLINESFQSSLMKMINTTQINKNVIISPLSIYLVLSICSNGAVDDTLSQMLKTLSPKSKDLAQLNKECYKLLSTFSKSDSIKVANAIFSKLPIMKKFKENEKFSKIIEEIKENSKKNQNIQKDSIIVSMEDVDNSYKLKVEKLQNQEAE